MRHPPFRCFIAAGLVSLVASAHATSTESAPPGPTGSREADKALVLAFHEAAFRRLDLDEARRYLGATFIQHAPDIADGVAGFSSYHGKLRTSYPRYTSEVRRVMSSDGLVTIHALQRMNPWDRGDAQIHVYRVQESKLVEHWAVGLAIPATGLNANGPI